MRLDNKSIVIDEASTLMQNGMVTKQMRRSAIPHVFAVPFPQGRYFDGAHLQLKVANQVTSPCQKTVLALWPDRSIRSCLFEWETQEVHSDAIERIHLARSADAAAGPGRAARGRRAIFLAYYAIPEARMDHFSGAHAHSAERDYGGRPAGVQLALKRFEYRR